MHGTLKMEKRTPNDVDDAGPIGQHHQHHWGPVSPFARLLGCLWPRPREFHGGFAMGILMDGVMGCRTYGGFMQVLCRISANFLLFFMMVFWCLRVGFHGPPAHPAIM